MEWGVLSTGAFSLGALIFTFYFWLTRNFSHFEKLGVPFRKPVLFYGNIKERFNRSKSTYDLQKEFYFAFKGSSYYGMFEGSAPVLFIREPDLIKEVLVKNFDHFTDRNSMKFMESNPYIKHLMTNLQGREWKQVRSALTPAFSSGRIKAMTELIDSCADHFIQYINKTINDNHGESVILEMKETLGLFTMDTIGSTAFGLEAGSCGQPGSEMSSQLAKFVSLSSLSRYILFLALFLRLPACLTRLLPVSFLNVETVNYLAGIAKEVSLKRKDPKYRRNDFLQLLIEAQSSQLSEDPASPAQPKQEKGFVLAEEVAIAQAILFFIAGYETSSSALSMLCYELAKNQEIQETLREEILHKLKEKDGHITYEMLAELNYLDMTISETLRMYPPAPRLDRVCVKEFTLNNIPIAPGEKIAIPLYGIHHDAEFYPEPEVFRPERFSQQEGGRHPFTWLPFGAGPRNCIGMRAALLSMKICMIRLLKEFTFDTCPKTTIPFEFDKTSILLKAQNGVFLQIKRRQTF